MSQNPNNPNHQPAAPAELSAEERTALSVDVAEEWRDAERAHMTAQASAADLGDNTWWNAFVSDVDDRLDSFLQQKGLDAASPNYAEIKQAFRDVSIDKVTEWQVSEQHSQPSPKDKFVELIHNRVSEADMSGDNYDEGNDSIELDPEKIAEIDELETELEELRDQMAEATAKRQDKFFGSGGKKYAELKAEYNAMIQEYGRRHLALHEGLLDEDKNLVAMTVIFDEQEKLRQKTIEELEGKPLGKFIKWMNKGNVATRIAKGVGLGVVAGVGGSFVAGAVGAGLVAGGAVIASRFARNFAIKDNKTRGMASIYSENDKSSAIDFDADELNTGAAMNFTDETNRMEKIAELTGAHEAFEEDTKGEQSKRIKSALFGTAMIGMGAVAGYGVHRGIELLADKDLTLSGYVANKWDEFWNGPDEKPPADGDPTEPGGDDQKDLWGPDGDRDDDGILNADDPDKDNDGVNNEDDFAPLNPDVSTDPNTPDMSEVPRDARWVEPGEGWYQTFQELGIPEEHWADTLEVAGPELEDQGWAYFDEANNEWRISQPGRLPDESLTVIADAAERDGFTLAA